MMNTPEEIQELKEKIAKGEPDRIENGKEVYEAPNGIRIKISDQEGADLVTGRSQSGDGTTTTNSVAPIEQPRTDFINEATHGADRATWRNESMKFTNSEQPGARLHVTQNQIESARKEMDDALEKQKTEGDTNIPTAQQEALDSNTKANEGFRPLTPMSENGKNFFGNQDDIAEQAKRDAAHQEALASNARANEGFRPLTPISENGKNFFDNQDNIAEQAKLDAAHQEALDSNARANEGFRPLTPMSENGKNFFDNQDNIAEQAKLDVAHQEALASNARANEGFTEENLSQKGQQSLENIDLIANDLRGKNFEKSLSELMDEETAKRYIDFLQGSQETPLVTTPEQTEINKKLGEIGTQLGEIDTRLETMDTRLNEINTNIQALLEGQEAGQLTQEKLLEYVKLLQEQNQLQAEISQSNAEKLRISMENAVNLILLKLGQTQPTPVVSTTVGPTPVVPTTVGPTPVVPTTVGPTPVVPTTVGPTPVVPTTVGPTPVVPTTVGPTPVVPTTVGPTPVVPTTVGPTPVIPTTVGPTPVVPTTVGPTPVIPGPATASADVIRNLQDQLSELRGENTWEQRSASYAKDIEALDNLSATRPLTIAEKAQYFDLLKQKEYIDKNIIQPVEQEKEKKRIRKERIIKIVAGVAGAGIALATPAVGVAAVIAVTLGGRLIGKGLAKWGEKLRSTSNAMKYEDRRGKSMAELQEIDNKQKRKEWWGKRLGEASAVFIGGATGYGLGKAVQSIFGWGQGTTLESNPTTGEPTQPGGPAPQPEVPTQELPTSEIPTTNIPNSESVLVENGRINLDGSAWDDNLANGPAQDTLLGGELNYSNYNGGISEMASRSLENDLINAGITRPQLFENLQTPEIHQLINRYFEAIKAGNTTPDLSQMLDSVKPGVSDILIKN